MLQPLRLSCIPMIIRELAAFVSHLIIDSLALGHVGFILLPVPCPAETVYVVGKELRLKQQ